MDQAKLKQILTAVKEGMMATDEAMEKLKGLPSEIIDCAHLDHQRKLRTGIPEVIFGENKDVGQIIDIAKQMPVLGPKLHFNSETEKFHGEKSELANEFLKDTYREPFVIPDNV